MSVQNLTDDEARVRLAELCGWRGIEVTSIPRPGSFQGTISILTGRNPAGVVDNVPAFSSDLNACREVEVTLTDEQHAAFRRTLKAIVARDAGVPVTSDAARRAYVSASARQRTEALILTLGGAA